MVGFNRHDRTFSRDFITLESSSVCHKILINQVVLWSEIEVHVIVYDDDSTGHFFGATTPDFFVLTRGPLNVSCQSRLPT
jgi:hypothetical protein